MKSFRASNFNQKLKLPETASLPEAAGRVNLLCPALCSVDHAGPNEAPAQHSLAEGIVPSKPNIEAEPDHQIPSLPAGQLIQEMAERLRSSRSPWFQGLEYATCETQRLMLHLAEVCRAKVASPLSEYALVAMQAVQQVGQTSLSWGEIAQRADCVVLWQIDLAHVSECVLRRLGLKQLVQPPPNFQHSENSEKSHTAETKQILAVNSRSSSYSAHPAIAQAVSFRRGCDYELLALLQGLLQQKDFSEATVQAATGVPLEELQSLHRRIAEARYVVVLYDAENIGRSCTPPLETASSSHVGHGQGGTAQPVFELLFRWVQQLNRITRAACCSLPGATGNEAGADEVACWTTGFPLPLDFSSLPARFAPELAAAEPQKQGDVRLSIEKDRMFLEERSASSGLWRTVVSCPISRWGPETSGTIVRSDGVTLHLKPWQRPTAPSAEEVLRQLLKLLAPERQLSSGLAGRNFQNAWPGSLEAD